MPAPHPHLDTVVHDGAPHPGPTRPALLAVADLDKGTGGGLVFGQGQRRLGSASRRNRVLVLTGRVPTERPGGRSGCGRRWRRLAVRGRKVGEDERPEDDGTDRHEGDDDVHAPVAGSAGARVVGVARSCLAGGGVGWDSGENRRRRVRSDGRRALSKRRPPCRPGFLRPVRAGDVQECQRMVGGYAGEAAQLFDRAARWQALAVEVALPGRLAVGGRVRELREAQSGALPQLLEYGGQSRARW